MPTSEFHDLPVADAVAAEIEPAPEATAPDVSLTATAACPEGVPEKFWDAESGTLRTESLLRSYLELERRLGRSLPKPSGEDDVEALDRLASELGRPDTPEGYELSGPHPLIEPDPDLNARLHRAGFTRQQAQLVYDLAAEHILPIVNEAAAELDATRQIDKLQQHFGGAESWRNTAAQIRAYAEANLPAALRDALATSYEGVIALHEMMRKAEPEIVGVAGSGQLATSEESLRELIRDPRYWRDRDPETVRRVTEGYRQLYPD